MTTNIQRAAGSGDTTDLDVLSAEWRRLRRLTGRTDDQCDIDADRAAEIEALMAAIPAKNIWHVAAKLTAFASDAYGGNNSDAHPLIRSAIVDLGRLSAGTPALAGVAPNLTSIANDLEDLQCKLGTFRDALADLGEAVALSDDIQRPSSLYAAMHIFDALHRDVSAIVHAVSAIRSAELAEGGAA